MTDDLKSSPLQVPANGDLTLDTLFLRRPNEITSDQLRGLVERERGNRAGWRERQKKKGKD